MSEIMVTKRLKGALACFDEEAEVCREAVFSAFCRSQFAQLVGCLLNEPVAPFLKFRNAGICFSTAGLDYFSRDLTHRPLVRFYCDVF